MFEVLRGLTEENRQVIDTVIAQFMENSVKTRTDSFRALNRVAGQGGIVFAGDSITEGYAVSELFPRGLPVYNRGIGGITSRQLLDNLDAHICGLCPNKVFLLIGTNDIQRGDSLAEIAGRIKGICEQTVSDCPDAQVYVLAVYPVNNTNAIYAYAVNSRNNTSISKLNELIETGIAGMERVSLVDLTSQLKDQEGNLREEYTADGLHLSVGGGIKR